MALLLMLVAVAVIGAVSAYGLQVGAQVSRRDAEEELLQVGLVFHQALLSYINSTPGQAALGPRSLDELLRDPRVPGLRRHLRRIPADPLTGRAEWGLVRSPDGQIVGIHSLADGQPIKRAGFEPPLLRLNAAESYRAWVFGPAQPPAPAASSPRTLGTSSNAR